MARLVLKYGGSSVESVEKMRKIAERIIKRKSEGYDLVVVVSAMGKTTNQLINTAFSVCSKPSKRELDVLLSTGEQVSISLLTMLLNSLGVEAISLTGFQAGIKTEGLHTKNKITDIDETKITSHLNEGRVVVVAGFQGMNELGDITTLGRGGSDTTAVAIAAKLGCSCEIYTDVDGIYSIDPRVYKNAKKLDAISYEEMMEMSCLGAKIMETRSVEIAKCYHVPIYVASSNSDEVGSYIKEWNEEMEQKHVTGCSVNDNVLMITINKVPYTPQNIAWIFGELATRDINVDMISQTSPVEGYVNISFTTMKEEEEAINEVMNDFKFRFNEMEVLKDQTVSKVSVVGLGMRYHSGVAAKIFKLFADHDIVFKQVTTSDISISYTIHSTLKEKAVRLLAESFNL